MSPVIAPICSKRKKGERLPKVVFGEVPQGDLRTKVAVVFGYSDNRVACERIAKQLIKDSATWPGYDPPDDYHCNAIWLNVRRATFRALQKCAAGVKGRAAALTATLSCRTYLPPASADRYGFGKPSPATAGATPTVMRAIVIRRVFNIVVLLHDTQLKMILRA
jgi:hypothetical protein